MSDSFHDYYNLLLKHVIDAAAYPQERTLSSLETFAHPSHASAAPDAATLPAHSPRDSTDYSGAANMRSALHQQYRLERPQPPLPAIGDG
jgi:hypothetical protein